MKDSFWPAVLAAVLLITTSGICSESEGNSLDLAKIGFLERWHEFQGNNKNFALWSPALSEAELKSRFEQIQNDRRILYFVNSEKETHPREYAPLYARPEKHKLFVSRHCFPGSFSYNLASPSYNASIVTLNEKQFLALEAPTRENVSQFCTVLDQYHVTDLIRLTPAFENNKEACFPYWEGAINISPKNGRSTVEIAKRQVRYFFTDRWEDRKPFDPARLIALIKAVRENEEKDQMIAVHCHAGVGRTGVFLTAYELLREIDAQIAKGIPRKSIQISIDRVIWEVSLQRASVISDFPQYASLYQLVDMYLESRANNKGFP